jgi:hypothetical protein
MGEEKIHVISIQPGSSGAPVCVHTFDSDKLCSLYFLTASHGEMLLLRTFVKKHK